MNGACNICGNTINNTIHWPREMMFGFRDIFEYIECSKCGCLQISNIPENIIEYYPDNYYSYSLHNKHNRSIYDIAKFVIKTKRLANCYNNKGVINKIINIMYGVSDIVRLLNNAKVDVNSNILDVGCGDGHLLLNLRACGFSRLTGIDPFIEKDVYYENGVQIFKKNIYELEEQYDLIMLNHSFEHMSEPIEVFKSLSTRLTRNGYLIIRIPTVSSYAWKHYKINWVQLDAPRHLYLHSNKSIEMLANMAGLRIDWMEYDSSSFQFWGSEQYMRDIPLYSENSYLKNKNKSIFTRSEIVRYEKKSIELNANNDGDQVVFYFNKLCRSA